MAEIISVSALHRFVKTLLESDSVLDGLAVRGEIAGFVHHLKTGHYYFSLRDGQCSVRAVMFSRDAQRVPFTPENGMKVITMLIPADFTRQSEAYAKLKISLPSKYPFVEFSFIVLSFL